MAGFSLIELAIVLVILGLLVGGIMSGQSLIRAAEIHSVITQYQNFGSSIDIFRDKYDEIPGDMANATSLWGAADGGDGLGTDCHSVSSVGTETCNGNGDGYPGSEPTTANGGGVNANGERFRFWQHLANAGLIEGKFTGRTDSTSDVWAVVRGKNVPPAKIGNAFWTVASISPNDAFWYNTLLNDTHAEYFPSFRDKIQFDIRSGPSSFVLNTEEIYSLDSKTDDGKPGYGKIIATKRTGSFSPNCTTSDSAATAAYDLSNKTSRCMFFMGKPIAR
jgi:prepilin-type N-terminal cleavage/methylation domain-containing protein